MCDDGFKISIVVFDMDFSDSELLLFDLAQQGQLVLFFNHFTAFSFLIGPVPVTFLPILLNQRTKHKDRSDIIFLNHSVKVIKRRSQRTLCSNNLLSLKLHNISIDIVLDPIFLLGSGQNRFSRIKSHYMGISIVRELLRILVQFLKVVLGLSHESENLEFRRQGTILAIHPKLRERNRSTHLFDVSILISPLQGNVLEVHIINFFIIIALNERTIYFIYLLLYSNNQYNRTKSMLFKPLPENLDFFVLNDHLFQTLQKSKQTKSLIGLRAQEIVKSILRESLQSELHQKLRQLTQALNQKDRKVEDFEREIQKIKENQQKKKKNLIKQLKLSTEQQLIKANAELQAKDQEISQFSEQIQRLCANFQQLSDNNQKLLLENSDKEKQVQSLKKQLEDTRKRNQELQGTVLQLKAQIEKKLFSHQQQMQKANNKHKILNATISELQQVTKDKQQQIQDLTKALNQKQVSDTAKSIKLESELKKSNRQVQRLSKELRESQENYALMKKQISKFKDKYRKFEQDYTMEKKLHGEEIKQKSQLLQKQNDQILMLSSKLRQISDRKEFLEKSRKMLKAKITKLQKTLATSIFALKQENITLRSYAKQIFSLIKEYAQTQVTKIVNHLSNQLSEYFQECIFEIKKAREEKNMARQEAKMKSEVIEQLDKMLNNEAKSVYDLRYELKQKIKEEEKLRKKLKHHYQETDKKLEDFHSKYVSILKNQIM